MVMPQKIQEHLSILNITSVYKTLYVLWFQINTALHVINIMLSVYVLSKLYINTKNEIDDTCTLHVHFMYILMYIFNVLHNVPPIVHQMCIIMYITPLHNVHFNAHCECTLLHHIEIPGPLVRIWQMYENFSKMTRSVNWRWLSKCDIVNRNTLFI